MKLVYISFPLNNRKINEDKVDEYYRYVIDSGFLPIEPRLIIEKFKRNYKNSYINKRLELLKRCDQMWIFQKDIVSNMVDEIKMAELLKIPIRYIELKKDASIDKQLYKYKKMLKKINTLIYSEDLYKLNSGFIDELEFKIEVDEDLSEIQKRYLIKKLDSYPLTFGYLDKGYKYIWNLNNNIRSYSLYIRTMYYISSLESINKKKLLIERMLKFIEYDKIISKHRKQNVIERLKLIL